MTSNWQRGRGGILKEPPRTDWQWQGRHEDSIAQQETQTVSTVATSNEKRSRRRQPQTAPSMAAEAIAKTSGRCAGGGSLRQHWQWWHNLGFLHTGSYLTK